MADAADMVAGLWNPQKPNAAPLVAAAIAANQDGATASRLSADKIRTEGENGVTALNTMMANSILKSSMDTQAADSVRQAYGVSEQDMKTAQEAKALMEKTTNLVHEANIAGKESWFGNFGSKLWRELSGNTEEDLMAEAGKNATLMDNLYQSNIKYKAQEAAAEQTAISALAADPTYEAASIQQAQAKLDMDKAALMVHTEQDANALLKGGVAADTNAAQLAQQEQMRLSQEYKDRIAIAQNATDMKFKQLQLEGLEATMVGVRANANAQKATTDYIQSTTGVSAEKAAGIFHTASKEEQDALLKVVYLKDTNFENVTKVGKLLVNNAGSDALAGSPLLSGPMRDVYAASEKDLHDATSKYIKADGSIDTSSDSIQKVLLSNGISETDFKKLSNARQQQIIQNEAMATTKARFNSPDSTWAATRSPADLVKVNPELAPPKLLPFLAGATDWNTALANIGAELGKGKESSIKMEETAAWIKAIADKLVISETNAVRKISGLPPVQHLKVGIRFGANAAKGFDLTNTSDIQRLFQEQAIFKRRNAASIEISNAMATGTLF